MKVKIPPRMDAYHPEDTDFAQCAGWRQALIDFPGLAEFAAQHTEIKKHGDVYNAFFPSLPTFPTVEIETTPCSELGKVLLKWTEKLFLLAAEQAAREISTLDVEEQIQKNKIAVQALHEHKDCVCAVLSDGTAQKIRRETKLSVLLSIPQKTTYFCEGFEGIIPLLPIALGNVNPTRIFIILPMEKRNPKIRLGWDGKHFVALYPEAIRELGIPQGVLALMPPATAEAKAEEEDDENEE